MKLTPYQKADLLAGIAILLGMAGMFFMTQELSEAFWAPQLDLPPKDTSWQIWAWLAWMSVVIYIGLILPERLLRHAHKNWRTVPNCPQDPSMQERRQQQRRRYDRGGSWPQSERRAPTDTEDNSQSDA